MQGKTENKNNILCFKCKHFIENESCGSCISKTIKKMDNYNELEYFKYACKIVINDSSDFNNVNPLDCKYFFSKSIQLRF